MESKDFNEKYYKKIGKYTIAQVICNVFFTVIKIFGGIFTASGALLSDGINSLGDCLTSFISALANRAASKKADKEHQFGHEKIENYITLLFSILIILSGLILIYEAIVSIVNGKYKDGLDPELLVGIIISVFVIVSKFILGIVVYFGYKKTNSALLKAQSTDHFLDTIGSFITLIVLTVLYLNIDNESIRILDPIASIIIAIIILIGGIRIFIENSNSLLDRACSKEVNDKIKKEILEIKGVLHIDLFKSRMASNRIFIDVEVSVGDNLSLKDAHDIAENIKEKVLMNNSEVKAISVHINPSSHLDQDSEVY